MSRPARDAPSRAGTDELDPARLAAVQDELTAWYAANARDLPWRHTRDPYRILVSEVMLQQIQVARAIPFYLAFLERFPTIRDLAAAPLAEVIRVWGNLGRYRRIVNLHRTAQRIVEEFGGEVPRAVATLETLPGIGPYTAGAVACFAFEQDAGFLDTNSRRVIHRLFVGSDAPGPTATVRELRRIADLAVPRGRGWVWNQALIEYGALRCTARRPACASCSLQSHCRAYPAAADAAAVGSPPAARKSSSGYAGTNRYYRGRALAALRELSPEDGTGLDLRSLGARLREDFTDDELPWIAEVVESLRRDGLAAVVVGAIHEQRPAYDAGGAEHDPNGVRVTLP